MEFFILELVYLYIEKYGVFAEQQFNFGDRLRFEYRKEIGNICVTENPFFINDFFNSESYNKNNSKIQNVTAIVGENGAGKSTLLRYIKENLVDGAGGTGFKAIIIAKEKNNYKISYHKDIQVNEIENQTNKINFSYDLEIFSPENIKGPLIRYPSIDSFKNVSFIFFSNIFDNEREEEFTNLYNLSTNFLIKDDHKKQKELGLYKEIQSESEVHRLTEINRQIFFIENFRDYEKIPFKLPLKISISTIIPQSITQKEYGSYESFINKVFYSLDRKLEKLSLRQESGIQSRIQKFKINFYKALISNFFYEINNFFVNIEKSDLILEDILGEDIFKKIKNVFLLEGMQFYHGDLSNSVINLLNYIEGIIDGSLVSYDMRSINLAINSNSNNVIEFISLYRKTFTFRSYLNFDWRGLSSGQKALLNILARFNFISDENITDNLKLKKDIIVLIDEGEVYFHPQWQKSLLLLLIDALPLIFKGRQIQIIVTSNSPFIVSDLPSSNIIFLKKEQESSVVVDGLTDNKQTFAANIHTLYSDSFFMSNGFIGDFAKKKINYVINSLINEPSENIYQEKDKLEKIINMIGEPIIRNKLINMLQEKVAVNILSINERIEDMQRQIDELRKR